MTKDELHFWLCRFVNEARRQDSKYIHLFLSNICQFCNAAAVTDMRERERQREERDEREETEKERERGRF